MDIEAACRAFVAVSDRGGFTRAAAALGVAQPMVSRRVAAFETHLGGRLLDRASRGAVLTPLGRRLLPAARRVVESVDDLLAAVAVDEPEPFRLAVPDDLSATVAAALLADAKEEGVLLRFVPAGAARRRELVRTGVVDAALVPVAPPSAHWLVPLGLGSGGPSPGRQVFLDELRPRRGDDGAFRRIWVTREDDSAHVGDALVRRAVSAGCLPHQVVVAELVTALAEVTTSHDLLLCGERQARDLGLEWARLSAPGLARGYRVEQGADVASDVARLLGPAFARAIGAPGAASAPEDAP